MQIGLKMTYKKLPSDVMGPQVYVPAPGTGERGPRLRLDAVNDAELSESGIVLDPVLQEDPLTKGIDFPVNRRPPFSKLEEERWIVSVELLMQRGVKTMRHISELTGLSYSYTVALVNGVKDRWSKTLTIGQVNIRREAIYMEADRVKDECWKLYAEENNKNFKIAYLRMIIDAGKRQSAMIGADRINLSVETSSGPEHKSRDDLARDAAEKLNIPEDSFSLIGDNVAKQITLQRRTDDE